MCVSWKEDERPLLDNRQQNIADGFEDFFSRLLIRDISDKNRIDTFVDQVSTALESSSTPARIIRVQSKSAISKLKSSTRQSLFNKDRRGSEPSISLRPRVADDLMPKTRPRSAAPQKQIARDELKSFLVLADLTPNESQSHNDWDSLFMLYPNILGQTGHQSTGIWANFEGDQATERLKIQDICDETQAAGPISCPTANEVIATYLATDANQKKVDPDQFKRLQFVVHKMLPGFYSQNSPLNLASVAVGNKPELQTRALSLLELFMMRQSTEHKLSFQDLIETAQILTPAMRNMRSGDHQSLGADKLRLLIQDKTYCVLLMVLSQLLLDYQKDPKANTSQWNSFVKKAKQSLLVPTGKGSNREEKQVNVVLKFLEKSSKTMTQFVHGFLETDTPSAGNLLNHKERSQFIVIFECLKRIFQKKEQIFQKKEIKLLNFLEDYLELRKVTKESTTICNKLILVGLSHFLSYVTKEAANYDIKDVCEHGIQAISIAFRMVPEDEAFQVCAILRQLLLNNVPLVKSVIAEIIKRKGCGPLEQHILREVQELLFPLLKIKENLKADIADTDTWYTETGIFTDQNVKVIVQKQWNSSDAMQLHDERHSTQMAALRSLQHPSIVKLFAYQRDCCPHFYILEHAITLQEVLENRNENNRKLLLRELIKFLVDAASALEFCHSRYTAHCNLNAASLNFMGEMNQIVKLSGFELAVDLGKDEEEQVVENNMKDIPTRWSAPETLKGSKFSKATDVWMFGHLMYEVLSHGVLPYSHLQLSDSHLVWQLLPQVVKRHPKLCKEDCVAVYKPHKANPETHIQEEHFELITKCVEFDPERREDMLYIKTQLEDFLDQLSTNKTAVGRNHRCDWKTPSIQFNRGLPEDIFSHEYVPEQFMVLHKERGMLRFYKSNHVHLIRQIAKLEVCDTLLEHKLPNALCKALPWLFIQVEQEVEDGPYNQLNHCFFDCHIPEANVEDMNTVLEQRSLGENLQRYLALLLQVLKQLATLHRKSFVLGDFNASNFYLNPDSTAAKVYTVGLENLQWYRPGKNNVGLLQTCSYYMDSRVPPEIKTNGTHTPATDVFYFGLLLKKFFDQLGITVCKKRIQPLKKNPSDCCRPLLDLATQCLDKEETQRPTIKRLVEQIRGMVNQHVKRQFQWKETSNKLPVTKSKRKSYDDAPVRLPDVLEEPMTRKGLKKSASDAQLCRPKDKLTRRKHPGLKEMNASDSLSTDDSETQGNKINPQLAFNCSFSRKKFVSRQNSDIMEINPSDSTSTSTDTEFRTSVPRVSPSSFTAKCSCSFFGHKKSLGTERPDRYDAGGGSEKNNNSEREVPMRRRVVSDDSYIEPIDHYPDIDQYEKQDLQDFQYDSIEESLQSDTYESQTIDRNLNHSFSDTAPSLFHYPPQLPARNTRSDQHKQ